MTADDVRTKLTDILVSDFRIPREKITPEASFRGNLGMDSLDAVDLVFLVCKAFGMKPDLHPFRELHTLDKVVAFLVAELEKKPPPA